MGVNIFWVYNEILFDISRMYLTIKKVTEIKIVVLKKNF